MSGVKVTDQDLALDMLAEGLGAYFLFNTCVRKLNVIKRSEGQFESAMIRARLDQDLLGGAPLFFSENPP